MDTLPLDILGVFIEHLPFVCSQSLSMICRWTNQYLTPKLYNAKPFTTGRAIYNRQARACKRIDEKLSSGDSAILCAPMGFGKTLAALYYIKYMTKCNVLILTPPGVLKVWVDELTKAGMYNSDPTQSDVLICHSIRQAHYKHVKQHKDSNGSSLIFATHRIAIATINILKNDDMNREDTGLYVIDEIHKYNISLKRYLGLTAENARFADNKSAILEGYVTHAGRIPLAEFHYGTFNRNPLADRNLDTHIADFKTNTKYLIQIENHLQYYGKVAICAFGGDIANSIVNMLRMQTTHKFFNLKSGANTLNKFNYHAEPAVLLFRSSGVEGLNLLCEALIIVKPGMMKVERIKQVTGRILRPNNPYNDVHIHFFCTDTSGYNRTMYSRFYSHPNWNMKYDLEPKMCSINKSATIAKLLGVADTFNITQADGCLIFDTLEGEDRCTKMLKWWTDNKEDNTILDEDNIKMLYNV